MNKALRDAVREALRGVMDPELDRSLVDLGLIYAVEADAAGSVRVDMTTTTRGCPLAGVLKEMVAINAAAVPGVASVEVNLVYEPAWSPAMILP